MGTAITKVKPDLPAPRGSYDHERDTLTFKFHPGEGMFTSQVCPSVFVTYDAHYSKILSMEIIAASTMLGMKQVLKRKKKHVRNNTKPKVKIPKVD